MEEMRKQLDALEKEITEVLAQGGRTRRELSDTFRETKPEMSQELLGSTLLIMLNEGRLVLDSGLFLLFPTGG